IILGQERRNYIVDLGKTEAILPAHEQIPRETYRRGDRIKAYLLEVKRTQRDVQVILSRTHPNFIVKLFEAEVPEIAEKIVEIKGVVREPGDRTKIAVASRDRAVDPVGACVYEKERVVRDQETRAAIAQQLQEQHARLVQAESAAAAAQQASAEEAEPQATPAAGAPDSEAATG